MTTDSPATAGEVIAKLRDWRARNGEVLDVVIRREWMHHVELLLGELTLDLAALKIAAPYVTGTDDAQRVNAAIHRLSGVVAN